MNTLKQYAIPWKGLSDGSHRFDLDAGDSFFREFPESGIKRGKVRIETEVKKSASMLSLAFTMRGCVAVECDRCLEDIELPVEYDGRLQVKFSDETDDYDGDVMWVNPSENEVDLAQYIYESIVLSLPYQRVHGNGNDGRPLCDAKMLERFRIINMEEELNFWESKTEALADNPEAKKLKALKEKMQQ